MAKFDYFASGSTVALALGLGLWAGSSAAQTAPAVPPLAEEETEVIITGSFIRGTPEDAAMPVEAITLEEIRNTGTPTNMDLIKNLTEVGGILGESNRLNGFPNGSESANLRNLSSSRTVVLFNGRRFGQQLLPSGATFNNTAQIPNAAVGRVEVLKDGGASTYGADAVGGVINYITRKNLNGVEARSDYRFIEDSDGEYRVAVNAGTVGDNGNILISASFSHRSDLFALDRDWANLEYLENDTGLAWSAGGSPGVYSVTRDISAALGTFTASTITPQGAGLSEYSGTRQMGPASVTTFSSGALRDKYCTELGGFAGWSSSFIPSCYYHATQYEVISEEQNLYNLYGEANYEITPTLKFHTEGMFYKQELPNINISPSDVPTSNPNSTSQTSTSIFNSSTGGYVTPANNPAAVFYLQDLVTGGGATSYTQAQMDDVTLDPNRIGRINMVRGAWRPFGNGGRPDTGGATNQRNQSTVYRVTSELSGDLPDMFGAKLGFSMAGTYAKTYYTVATQDILVDRLNQALLGLGGPGCDTNLATFNIVEGGVPGVGACKWFNPFSSGVPNNPRLGLQNPLYAMPAGPAVTVNGQDIRTGTIPGYWAGHGLQNDPAMINWLWVPIDLRRSTDFAVVDLLFNVEAPIELGGGPIALAAGGQYRYTHEVNDVSFYADRGRLVNGVQIGGNPCPTIGDMSCSTTTRTGPLAFGRAAATLGATADSDRVYPVYSAFGEVKLPIFDNLNVQLATRYETFVSDVTNKNDSVLIGSGSAKWDVTDWFALRASASDSFGRINPPEANTTLGSITSSLTLPTFGGVTGASTASVQNTLIGPETGFNYDLGALFKIGNFTATIDYFNIRIGGLVRSPGGSNGLVAGVVVAGQTGSTASINCASPLLSVDPILGVAPVQLSGPCDGLSTVANRLAAGSTLTSYDLVNSGELKLDGVDANVSYRFDDFFGGALTLNGDVSYTMNYTVDALSVNGIELSPSYSGVGFRNLDTGKAPNQTVNEYRATAGFNYNVGRHNINWNTRFVSGVIDDRGDLFTATDPRNSNAPNCASPLTGVGTDDSGTNPAGAEAAGVIIGFDPVCNTIISAGREIPDVFNSDVTYRASLPWQTDLTVSVLNVFGEDPPFARQNLSYDSFTGSPLGRNYRVQLTKKF